MEVKTMSRKFIENDLHLSKNPLQDYLDEPLARRNQNYSIYILFLQSKHDSNNTRYYVGLTNNFQRRLKEHINGRSKYTSRFKILAYVIVESEIETLAEARKRELYYKSLKRAEKESFFNEVDKN